MACSSSVVSLQSINVPLQPLFNSSSKFAPFSDYSFLLIVKYFYAHVSIFSLNYCQLQSFDFLRTCFVPIVFCFYFLTVWSNKILRNMLLKLITCIIDFCNKKNWKMPKLFFWVWARGGIEVSGHLLLF